jgi:hypothetical protein
VTVTIPQGQIQDTATLQVGGGEHCSTCNNWKGYKGYIGIEGGKNGIGTEYGGHQGKPGYKDFPNSSTAPGFTLHVGHTYNLRATKENIGNTVRVTVYAQEGNDPITKVAQVTDTGQLQQYEPTTPFLKREGDGPPIDQLRFDNWPEPAGSQTKQVHSVVGGPFGG